MNSATKIVALEQLKDVRILITGASRGIGRATALLAGMHKAQVGVHYFTHKAQAREVAKEIAAYETKAITVQGDVAEYADCEHIARTMQEKLGGIDVLINNAGVISWKPMLEEQIERLQEVVQVNMLGLVHMIHATAPYMKEQKQGGVIVNIASGAGKTAYPHLAVYSATKFGVLGLTQALGEELYPDYVRVYGVCPGTTATDMTDGQGMSPEKVARTILLTAVEELDLHPGEDVEIYR